MRVVRRVGPVVARQAVGVGEVERQLGAGPVHLVQQRPHGPDLARLAAEVRPARVPRSAAGGEDAGDEGVDVVRAVGDRDVRVLAARLDRVDLVGVVAVVDLRVVPPGLAQVLGDVAHHRVRVVGHHVAHALGRGVEVDVAVVVDPVRVHAPHVRVLEGPEPLAPERGRAVRGDQVELSAELAGDAFGVRVRAAHVVGHEPAQVHPLAHRQVGQLARVGHGVAEPLLERRACILAAGQRCGLAHGLVEDLHRQPAGDAVALRHVDLEPFAERGLVVGREHAGRAAAVAAAQREPRVVPEQRHAFAGRVGHDCGRVRGDRGEAVVPHLVHPGPLLRRVEALLAAVVAGDAHDGVEVLPRDRVHHEQVALRPALPWPVGALERRFEPVRASGQVGRGQD